MFIGEGGGYKTRVNKHDMVRFWDGDLDLPERRTRYTRSRVEEEVVAPKCPCGKAMESRTHVV